MIELLDFAMQSWQHYLGSLTYIAILGIIFVSAIGSFKPIQNVKIIKNDTGSWDSLIEGWEKRKKQE